MTFRTTTLITAALCAIIIAGGAAWWITHAPEPPPAAMPAPEAAVQTPAPSAGADATDMPVPPFPPRIAEGEQYDQCMTMLTDDPEGAEGVANAMRAAGDGIGATHCQALAKIANGEPEAGAVLLEGLAHGQAVESLTKVILLGQAAEARLMAEQPKMAVKDTSEALEVAPDDTDLLFSRATAYDDLDREAEAMADLTRILTIDPARGDALVLRATIWRQMDRLEPARQDLEKALAMNPDDADALVERGILRQIIGDLAGARSDWTHARDIDPNSEAAELAIQNLTLLDSGPRKRP